MTQMVETMPQRKVTDESVYTELCSKGFCLLPGYLSPEQTEALVAAAHRVHPSWSDLPPEQLPPPGSLPEPNAIPTRNASFPFEEPCLNQAIVAPDTIALAQRWLGTTQICMRGSACSVRYPGFVETTGRHVDGFSLLPTVRRRIATTTNSSFGITFPMSSPGWHRPRSGPPNGATTARTWWGTSIRLRGQPVRWRSSPSSPTTRAATSSRRVASATS